MHTFYVLINVALVGTAASIFYKVHPDILTHQQSNIIVLQDVSSAVTCSLICQAESNCVGFIHNGDMQCQLARCVSFDVNSLNGSTGYAVHSLIMNTLLARGR